MRVEQESRIAINSDSINNNDCADKDGIDINDKWIKKQRNLAVV